MASSIGIFERMRWMSALAGAAILTLAVTFALASAHGQLPSLSSSTSAPAPAGSSAPLDPRIASLAGRRPGARLEAIVQFNNDVSLTRARVITQRAGGRVAGTLSFINALAVKMTAAQARSLAASSAVHSVTLNSEVTSQGGPKLGKPEQVHPPRGQVNQLQTTYNDTLGTSQLWRAGETGAGVGVAVIDTGIDGNLVDFNSDSGSSRVVATAVTNPDAKTVFDTYGHGTDVAGIIAGDGGNRGSSDPLRGQYVGVAPAANLVAIKASDEKGNASVLDVIYGIEFAIAHQRDYNIRVLNLSLDAATPQSYKVDPLDAAVEAAWAHGIVVVAAAGNRGSDANAVQFAPANDPYVITVGATDENGSANPTGDTIAAWSSRGVTQDGFAKPDVYAPGAHIVSVLAPNSQFAQECPSCVIGGQYIRTSGTSMAAPMISGLVADVLSKHAELTPNQVKGALTDPMVRSLPALQEPSAVKAALDFNPHAANQGLTPSKLLSSTGNIAGNWSFSSWSVAQGGLKAPFAFASWSCASCTTQNGGDVKPTFGTWSFASWSTIQDQ
jgi:serine protease AprX